VPSRRRRSVATAACACWCGLQATTDSHHVCRSCRVRRRHGLGFALSILDIPQSHMQCTALPFLTISSPFMHIGLFDSNRFTAWSSTRGPTQVLVLLETIYHAIDEYVFVSSRALLHPFTTTFIVLALVQNMSSLYILVNDCCMKYYRLSFFLFLVSAHFCGTE
jgi:hypothetical protein